MEADRMLDNRAAKTLHGFGVGNYSSFEALVSLLVCSPACLPAARKALLRALIRETRPVQGSLSMTVRVNGWSGLKAPYSARALTNSDATPIEPHAVRCPHGRYLRY